MLQKTLAAAGALTAFACGAAQAPAPKQAQAASAAPVVPVPAAPRVPSAELRRYWIFGEGRQLALYGGIDSLMHTELFAGLVPGVVGQLDDLLKSKQRDCINVLTTQSREVSIGADAHGGLVTLEMGPEGVKAARSACVGSVFPVERIAVVGADEAYAADSNVVAVQPGVVLFGTKGSVEAALAAANKPTAFPADLVLKDDQQLVFQLNLAHEGVTASGALRVNPQRFRLEADVELPSEALADMVEQKLASAREQAGALAQKDPTMPVAKLASALKVERHGKHFKAAFELAEPTIDQAHDLGVLAGLSIYGARRYIQDAKSAEARAVLAQIAKDYAATLSAPPAAGARRTPKKLVSFPAVPATVPRGVKYQSLPDDWKAWAPIQFAITEPQSYQYQVVAAKDGKTAEIVAHGDLDGNGVTSTFRLKIQLDLKTGEITAVDHSEEAPLE
jgi:hypothetical protein